ncbi:MAG: alpha/beta hydrolase [Firmicutes bacterium]|nr:alpha/beta hydrolase [Bacillota bacterium]
MIKVMNEPGVIADTEIKGSLIVNVPAGQAVINRVNIDGDLIVKAAGRVDFSGKADKIIVESDNADVYAISGEAEFAESKILGQNSHIITKSFADYQTVDWEEKRMCLSTGINLVYTVTGPEKGIPIILIHGVSDARVTWSHLAPMLADKGYRVYVPEYRGNGKTDKPYGDDEAYSVSELTKDIISFMEILNIESAHFVGYSLGSIIAQELNILHKEKVKSITLIASGVNIPAENENMVYLLEGDEDFKGLLGYEDTQKFPDSFIEGWAENTNPDPDLRKANLEHLRQMPYYVWKALMLSLLKFDDTERLKDITGDVQVIWGSEDTVFPRSQQEILKQGLVNCRLTYHEIEGADHNTHWGSDEALNKVFGYICEFIK